MGAGDDVPSESALARKATGQAKAHKWGSQIRREFDTLVRGTEGLGASSLFEAICTEAVIADNGTLKSTAGEEGYAWDPNAASRKKAPNAAVDRVKSAGGSLGRVLSGGHPDHRSYLAFLEAVYQVTTAQDYDVTERIEMLWDQMAQDPEVEEEPCAPRRGWVRRAWEAIVRYFTQGWA